MEESWLEKNPKLGYILLIMMVILGLSAALFIEWCTR